MIIFLLLQRNNIYVTEYIFFVKNVYLIRNNLNIYEIFFTININQNTTKISEFKVGDVI